RRARGPGHRRVARGAGVHQHGREHGAAAHEGAHAAPALVRGHRHPRELRGGRNRAADRLRESLPHARETRVSATRTLLVMAAGTGGHIMPGLAIARELAARGWRVHWMGTPRGMENRLV